ncbi:hypothetical protein [Leucobacter sp. 7(1)]|uniref:hypothetical protein n=1 Tax=Leucobacter sp. 7(1) TaxID=1255613 RepID=UPI00111F3FCB|nr:hypothetical protein [Leucobacter sp. 7(1)]
MNEHFQPQPTEQAMPERRELGEAHLAPSRMTPDWRRVEVASHRFGDHIADGIAKASEYKTLIEHGTARCIAHVLGRALDRSSALAAFGRTGEADYAAMRDEYLALYSNPDAPAWVVEQIDWLGTHLIRTAHPSAQTISYREPYPLTLEELLVPTEVRVGELEMTVQVPGCYDGSTIMELQEVLTDHKLDRDPGLQAYLSLPNVNAMSGDIMEGFHNSLIAVFRHEEAALRSVCDLDEREREIEDFVSERGLYYDYLTPDLEVLREQVQDMVDLVEREDRVYVFYK